MPPVGGASQAQSAIIAQRYEDFACARERSLELAHFFIKYKNTLELRGLCGPLLRLAKIHVFLLKNSKEMVFGGNVAKPYF